MKKGIKNSELSRDINNDKFVCDPMELSLVDNGDTLKIVTGSGKDYIYYNYADANADWKIVNEMIFSEK